MSHFYKTYSKQLLIVCLIVLPFLILEGESMPSNNDIETWLPTKSEVRQRYESFKDLFGAEEVILVGLPSESTDQQLTESLAHRIEALSEIRQCWSPDRFREVMTDLGVSEGDADARLTGLAISSDKELVGLVALLSNEGLKDRAGTVANVREILNYCQFAEEDILLTGAPVIVAELNRLGSIENNRVFFIMTQLICFVLLYLSIREWKMSGCILLITIVAIELTNCIVKWGGGEMNFILAALPVMVMVFTIATSIHFLHYYQAVSDQVNPLKVAMRSAWKPCGLATLTTAIGLLSLMVSDFAPVRQFGVAASIGALVAMICGLGITPMLLVMWPDTIMKTSSRQADLGLRLSHWIIKDRLRIIGVSFVILAFSAIGVGWLHARIDPLDFLPRNSKVIADLMRVEKDLTNVDSIEVVYDFGTEDISFVEKLNRIRVLDAKIAEHPQVRHTMSLSSFFPHQLPTRPLEAARLLSRAQASHNSGDYLSVGQRFWRVSARIQGDSISAKKQTFIELEQNLKGFPVELTGIAPLLEQAQSDIFKGFWESFASAFVVITLVMIVALRSISLSLIAMIPNFAPICIVFGILGWMGTSVDIGMMMTASIALGIAVDGTFHFVITYQKQLRKGIPNERASWLSLLHTGAPIAQAAIIASIGMLALTRSSFSPTVRFGWLMATLLLTAVLGDLILLPALMAISKKKTQVSSQHADSKKLSEIEVIREAA